MEILGLWLTVLPFAALLLAVSVLIRLARIRNYHRVVGIGTERSAGNRQNPNGIFVWPRRHSPTPLVSSVLYFDVQGL